MSLHIECGQAGSTSINGGALPVEIAGTLSWTETKATAGTSTNTVPGGGSFVLALTAEVDVFVAIAAVPDATVNPRRRMKAGTTRWFAAQSGQKVAWSAT